MWLQIKGNNIIAEWLKITMDNIVIDKTMCGFILFCLERKM